MSRVIKFRAWTGKEMYYQEDQYLASFIRRAVPKIIMAHDDTSWGEKTHESYLPNGGDIEEYLQQFTGLHDSKGVEIYEGDVVRYVPPGGDGEPSDERYVVEWLSYGFGASWINPRTPSSTSDPVLALQGADMDFEVIGNIHQHPHLLEQPS